MKTTIKTPNMTQYYLQLEPNDELYGRCTWAEINLDHDTYTMTATTDCGSYSYGWHPTPDHESFKKLMSRINYGYLLGKITEEEFDFDESKQLLLNEVEGYPEILLIGNKRDFMIDDVNDMEDCCEEVFLGKAMEITDWGVDDIPVVKKYPCKAETFAHIFTELLQPILLQELKTI